jgi:hypothetical protein
MSHCHAARSLPEHALSCAAGVRMTMKVRWGTLCHAFQCHAVRSLPPVRMTMKTLCYDAL